MIFDIGRVCVKTKGRDSNKHCVVINNVDDSNVMVDGNTRRKKVNINHLEPLDKTVDVKKDASTGDVLKALEGLGIKIKDISKKKEKKKAPVKEEKASEKKE